MPHRAIFNWSGGKDSALALHHIRQQGEYEIVGLLTTVSQPYQRVSMHGVRVSLLQQQAEALQLPLHMISIPETSSMEAYNEQMAAALQAFRQTGVTHSIYGDIFLEDLRQYREAELAKVAMQGIFPLWQRPTHQLLQEFMDSGFRAVIVCANAKYLDRSFVGRELDNDFLRDLPANVDPCGENGEYHSFVYDGPIFCQPISFALGEVIHRTYQSAHDLPDYDTGFWYVDLLS